MATLAPPAIIRERDHAVARTVAVPWYAVAVVFAATSIVVGLIWDISWHMTIGRDTFWTPAHLATYLGGIVSGVASGIVVLRTTFAGSEAERAASVRFWGFRGPLGAWVSIWGALTMITSAPFDDWWHNAYGLDVRIISPPHVVLALGILGIALGAMLYTLAQQNRAGDDAAGARAWMFAYGLGVIVILHSIMVTDYTYWIEMHGAQFYRVVCEVFPLLLVAATRASKLGWPATAVAGVYTVVRAIMLWVLPLFAAHPKLGPIYQDVTHMVPMDFPLLLVVPAVVVDILSRNDREPRGRDWRLALLYGVAFLAAFLAVQWPFAEFLRSRYSMNPMFGTGMYFYGLPKQSYMFRREFIPEDGGSLALLRGLAWALPISVVGSRLGLAVGNWMRKVQR